MPKGPPKGTSNNPKGKPKGCKNRRTVNLLDKLEEIDHLLEQEGKGLLQCAQQDPKWYNENFTKPRIPKNIELTGANGGPITSTVEVRFIGPSPKKNSNG